jgi:hypothetical protein
MLLARCILHKKTNWLELQYSVAMVFELYIPENLEFRDYITIVQSARTFADGYDRKVRLI